ncbi:hypothetical protein DEA8626_03717 [Defluviimonas aquaemixtae]|uniref:Uncharacterized protein n=1 Tax=Albidovulum aquaemixtae TaxID=1542388 RepID=A0A2R8BML1_9RHOB|nr:hypothetical protein [Defluviimonas aquaemixtae]SPH24681.1 hypothetical protein DEA8626_03717 [Defluviimonas aquaemixtae]
MTDYTAAHSIESSLSQKLARLVRRRPLPTEQKEKLARRALSDLSEHIRRDIGLFDG